MKRVAFAFVVLFMLVGACGPGFAEEGKAKFYGSVCPVLVIPDISTSDLKDIGFDADFDNGYGADVSGGMLVSKHVGIDIHAQYVTSIDASDTVWPFFYDYYYLYALPVNVDIDGSGHYISIGSTIFADRTKKLVPFMRFSIGSMGVRLKVKASYGPYSISDTESDSDLAFSLSPGILFGKPGHARGMLAVEYVVGRGDLDDVKYFAIKCGIAF